MTEVPDEKELLLRSKVMTPYMTATRMTHSMDNRSTA
jgi:hypothetical protein